MNATPALRTQCLAVAVAVLALPLLPACATRLLAVDDAVRFEDGRTRFVAFAQRKRGWVLSGVQGVDVRFEVAGAEVASGATDERGFVKAFASVAPADAFAAEGRVAGEDLRAKGRLVSWRSDRVIVACDIDSTISNTNLGALFFDDLDLTSTPIEDSPEMLHEIQRSHHLMYVTARPRFTLDKTRAWLADHGYPRDLVVTSLTVGDALVQTPYKTRTLGSLRKHYTNLLIGIGNTDIDADSYGAQGMLAVLLQPKAEVSREGHVVRLQSWQQIGAFFRTNAAVLGDPSRVAAAARGEQDLVLPD